MRAWFTVRVLLDECLPTRPARELTGHTVETVTGIGWSGVKNGELLRRAALEFDALITIDKRFADKLSVPGTLVLVTLVAHSNQLSVLKVLVPGITAVLHESRRGQRVRVAG